MKQIQEGLMQCWEEKRPCVVATIIQVNGSSYQREGARCLIYDNGQIEGMISGGCVESDLLEHAIEVLNGHMPKEIDYDFSWENDTIWGLGVGCNGAIKVWLEPFDPLYNEQKAAEILDEIQNRLVTDEPYVFLSVIHTSNPEELSPGTHWRAGKLAAERLLNRKIDNPILMETEVKGVKATIFAEPVKPLPRLYIFGTGPDAAMLSQKAYELSWRVCVVSHQEANLIKHFPHMDTIVIKRGEYASAQMPAGVYGIVMNHNLELDILAVKQLFQTGASYIGILGSRQRLLKMAETLHEYMADPELKDRVHSPVGLDIGAESPQEITLSILAELTAVKNNREGGPLCKVKIAQ